jgi:hypothetical protein
MRREGARRGPKGAFECSENDNNARNPQTGAGASSGYRARRFRRRAGASRAAGPFTGNEPAMRELWSKIEAPPFARAAPGSSRAMALACETATDSRAAGAAV